MSRVEKKLNSWPCDNPPTSLIRMQRGWWSDTSTRRGSELARLANCNVSEVLNMFRYKRLSGVAAKRGGK